MSKLAVGGLSSAVLMQPDRLWMAALGGLHFLLALGFCFVVFPRLGETTSGLDPDGYGHLGRVLYETGRFDSIDKPPLYPAWVALVAALTGGYHIAAIQVAQCLLAALGVMAYYAVFRRTLPNGGMARLAGLLCAVYPLTLWYAPRLWTETLLTVWVACYVLALAYLAAAPGLLRAGVCGLVAGLAALTKGIALVFIPLALAVILVVRSTRQSPSAGWWRPVAVFTLTALAVVLPWIGRNAQVSGALLPIHAEGGYNFYLGNGFARHWSEAPLSYTRLKALAEADLPFPIPADPLERDRRMLGVARQALAADLWLLPRKLLVGSLTFWYLAADAGKSLATGALQIPVVLLATWGAVRWVRRRAEWGIGGLMALLAPVVGIWGVSALVFSFGRLSAPVMPLVLALAVVGLWPARLRQK
jgi:4-amino-4-deoxy-L-arabinose transferase-like glycosyltransferase